MRNRTDRTHRRRRHTAVDQPDRRDLERAGWRTFLEYRENHDRRHDGALLGVDATWVAEAEWGVGGVRWASVTAPTVEEAWVRLREVVDSISAAAEHAPAGADDGLR